MRTHSNTYITSISGKCDSYVVQSDQLVGKQYTHMQAASRGARGASGGLEMFEIIGGDAEVCGLRNMPAPGRRGHDRGDLDFGIARALLESWSSRFPISSNSTNDSLSHSGP